MPPLPDRQAEAREWLAFARANVVHANLGRGAAGVFVEYLCFEAQQAAEKALKAVLILHGVRPPRTHILGELLSLLGNSGVDVPDDVQRAEDLSSFAVQTRYPGSADPRLDDDDLAEALSIAQAVIDWAAKMVEAAPPE